MSLLRSLSNGLRSLFRKERVERKLDEELRGFLEMAAEDKDEAGLVNQAMPLVRVVRTTGDPRLLAKTVLQSLQGVATQEALLSGVRISPLRHSYDHQ